MTPPMLIDITSDDTQIQFVRSFVGSDKEKKFVYKYVKSITKLGEETFIGESQLERQLNYYFKPAH